MTGSTCTADPDSPCAERVQWAPQEPALRLPLGSRLASCPCPARGLPGSSKCLLLGPRKSHRRLHGQLRPHLLGLAVAGPPPPHLPRTGHTAIAPTARPPVRSPAAGAPDVAGLCTQAMFDRKGPGFLRGARCGSEGRGACPQACDLTQCLPLAESLPGSWRVLPTHPSVCCASHTVWKVCRHLFVGAVGRARILGHQQRRQGGGALPSLHLAAPIPVSEFVQEAVRESLPCTPPMGPCPGCPSLLVPGLLTKAPVTVLPSPSPEQGPVQTRGP